MTDKENQETWIIDIAIPGDLRVREKEIEKREKYQDLAMQIRKLWKTSVKVVPIVVGALGTIGNARSDLETLGIRRQRDDTNCCVIRIGTHPEKDIESLRARDLFRDSLTNRQTIKGRVNKKKIIIIITTTTTTTTTTIIIIRRRRIRIRIMI